MAINTLRGLRKEQARQELTQYGYDVIRHRLNALDTEKTMQVLLNRLAKELDSTVQDVWHKVKCERYFIDQYARVRSEKDMSRIKDDLMGCLEYTDPHALHSALLNHTPDN